MSRIYENSCLQNKPVHSDKFEGVWSPSTYERGAGVLLEGKVLDVSRHVVSDVKNHKVRFYVLYVKPSRVHQRKFDDRGNEIEPNFSDTKKVNTGHLLSSYKVEAKGQSDRLSHEQLSAMVNKDELVKITEKHRPAGTWAFWFPETELDKTELETGHEVRLKTRGNCPFIFSIAKVEGGSVTRCTFTGDENAGASWTDKILANKVHAEDAERGGGGGAAAGGEGADEDEWDE
ncbi:hypothetical protein JOB18_013267 [Solea senegalensis]|uniref:Arpin n=1 Tax=Solea senegalensis TaxID=28829 RepID=A0AAV6PMD3_SOLSE|nr:arpin-like [Solea senegalensis]KAG7467698.1 hypothetical protein JOB18_013267 [Solea senegalensis]KAG7467699.1 hypothetical protein JOB18_013267 [Solea senegalensis]KAG7467700.1 hypothetical protein JOB18_013267 [Solea senegalensis]KAG7467701.1 hypothetical protein JOB18_013267 [Solea senegalensis]